MIETASRRTYRCREAGCGAEYIVRMLACHRCGGRDIEEVTVPKISVHGGPTHEAAGVLPEAVDELAGAQKVGPAEIEPDEPSMPVDDMAEVIESPSEIDYSKWSKPDLQAECDLRGLPRSGTVPQLIERLAADDAEHEEAPAS